MQLDAIAIIPARLASTRLPNKPLADLCGVPLIVRVCENAAASGVFSRILVACDDDSVAEAVRKAGFEASLTDPNLPSGTDRIAAVAKTLDLDPDTIIVNVQGDEPFVSRAALRSLVGAFRQNPLERSPQEPAAFAKTPSSIGQLPEIVTVIERCPEVEALRDPNVVKVAIGEKGRALYFSRAPIPYVRDADDLALNDQHYRHVGLYAFRAQTLQALTLLPEHPLERTERLEQLRWLAHGYEIKCVQIEPSERGIDTPADLDRARIIYGQFERQGEF